MKSITGKLFNIVFGKTASVVAVPSLTYVSRERDIDINYFDYIRISTLELLCYEIKRQHLPGSAAELGVFQGKFARYINRYLPDKNLYLFDTFEGFAEKDIKTEVENSYSLGDQDFKNTTVEAVLAQMPYRNNCIIKKGYFPDSANGIEDEQFCFVSLDADLFDPIYAGLRFFYQRLVPGGYIMVHDFNNEQYNGAKQAVYKFCDEERVPFFPIADKAGSAIISKK